MLKHKRKRLWPWYAVLVLALVQLPFVFVTDVYPLQRFGMFAEPVQTARQTSTYALLYRVGQQPWQTFDPRPFGITPAPFQVLLRRRYYAGTADSLLAQMAALPKLKGAQQLAIIAQHTQTDTLSRYVRR